MPTPKTPLPELLEGTTLSIAGGISTVRMSQEASAINQIITYLKEREETPTRTVEIPVEMPAPWLKKSEEAQPEKPGLKETLLGEIYAMSFKEHALESRRVMLKDVEEIINQVFRDNAN